MTMLPEHIINKIMLYVSHPIADMYKKHQEDEDFYDRLLNHHCECDGHCGCDENNLQWVSKPELLYILKNWNKQPNHKLEKILELKVVMNYLENQMGLYSYGKLLSNQNQRIEYITRKLPEIQQYHPMFYHCNKDLISNCLVIIIRNLKLELHNYDYLYDQFY